MSRSRSGGPATGGASVAAGTSSSRPSNPTTKGLSAAKPGAPLPKPTPLGRHPVEPVRPSSCGGLAYVSAASGCATGIRAIRSGPNDDAP